MAIICYNPIDIVSSLYGVRKSNVILIIKKVNI